MNPSVCYVEHKIRVTSKSSLIDQLSDICLKQADFNFVCDLIEGLSVSELSSKYKVSKSRIYKRRESLFERLHEFDVANEKK